MYNVYIGTVIDLVIHKNDLIIYTYIEQFSLFLN